MTGVETQSSRKHWPRFSLLTVLLLVTIAGMAIVIVQLWRELVPLREEVRRYRAELGFLTIDDPTQVQGIHVPEREDGWNWKWRVHFPPGVDYKVTCYTGIIPPGIDAAQRRDFQGMNPGPGGFSNTFAGNFKGEMIVEARLKQLDGKWIMQISFGGGGWSDLRLDERFAEYLSNPRGGGAFWMSNLKKNEQSAFAPDERIFLLKWRKSDVTEVPGGGISSRDPAGPAPGVALWIEPE
jgi:hypothetical protein